jgi:hypothetical protein
MCSFSEVIGTQRRRLIPAASIRTASVVAMCSPPARSLLEDCLGRRVANRSLFRCLDEADHARTCNL